MTVPIPSEDPASEGLRDIGEQFRAVVANVPGVVYRRDCAKPWTMRFISDHVDAVTGFGASDFIGDRVRTFGSVIYPDDREPMEAVVADALERDACYTAEYRVIHADGQPRWVSESGRVVRNNEGRQAWIDGVILDISKQKHAEYARNLAETQLRSVVADIPGIVYRSECREPWDMYFISDYVETLLGYPAKDFLDNKTMTFGELLHYDDRDLMNQTIDDVLERGSSYSLEYRLIHADGGVRCVSEYGRVIRDPDGTPLWLDGVILDMTRQRVAEEARDRAEALLRHQALHDTLTGLPNRTLFLDRSEQMLLRCRRDSSTAAVLFIDLDDFKAINDSLGHHAGDELLRAVGNRFVNVSRAGDTVGRLGGDEFVVLTEDASPGRGPERLAERLRDVLSKPFHLDGYEEVALTISASIGIATGSRASAQELLRDADVALYRAKAMGKRCHVVFDPEMRIRAANRLSTKIEMRQAPASEAPEQ